MYMLIYQWWYEIVMFTSWCVHCRYCCIHDCTCYMCYNVNEYMLMCWCVDVLMSTCWCVDACMLRCSKFLNFQDNYTVYCTSKNSFFAVSESTKNFLLFSLSLNFTLVSFLIKLFYFLTCYVENRYEEATVIDSLFNW